MQVFLENVRTFDGEHALPFGTVTVLTGENSTGKSTILGALSGMLAGDGFPFDPTFDEFPYSMGSYDTIATYKGGRYGRAKHFGVGYEVEWEGREWGPSRRVFAEYVSDRGRVSLDQLRVEASGRTLQLGVMERSVGTLTSELVFTPEEDAKPVAFELTLPTGDPERRVSGFPNALIEALFREGQKGDLREVFDEVINLSYFVGQGRVVSVAPIRTRPHRVYSKAKQAFDPGGDHVPFVLDRLFTDPGSRSERAQVLKALKTFGEESGLYEDVSIKKLGKKATDPFQVMIKVAGRARNLIDVGYGVSQSLPVVVQTVLEGPDSLILLQQPEVHLHPRAQAALGTFVAQMALEGKRRIVLETHSDFVLDRIRQEVANGTLPASEVQILFLHRSGYETTVYPLSLDEDGNVLGAPPHYRDFFLREELKLLSRTAD